MEPTSRALPTGESSTESHFDSQLLNSESLGENLQSTSTFVAPVSIDRYQVKSILGSGGFGHVYRAYDPVIRRDVAVKVPRHQSNWTGREEEEFLDEARKASLLRHPHVVMIYDAGKCPTHGVYIVMEYVAGETLAQYLSSRPIDISTTVGIIRESASAIHEAHQRGLIHRDLKPSNILLDKKGESRIADFGLALPEEKQATERNVISGTLPYMSPEQVRGHSHLLDGRSDIWSLGVILYQCLTGKRPFTGATYEDLREEIFDRAPKPLRQINDRVPRRLEDICLKCLSKSVSERYATAKDLEEELRDWEADPVSSGDRASGDSLAARSSEQLAESFRRESQRWTVRAAISLLSAVIIAMTGWYALHTDRDGGSTDSQLLMASGQPEATSAFIAPIRNGAVIPVAPIDVLVITQPPGARIVAYPISEPYGFPDGTRRVESDSRSPASLKLSPGVYLVTAALDDGRFHEVFRNVPADPQRMASSSSNHLFWRNRADGTIEWPQIDIPDAAIVDEMGHFEGADSFRLGSSSDSTIPEHNRHVAEFYLDTHEMTWGELLQRNKNKLPPSLLHLTGQIPESNLSVAGIWYHDAVSLAERFGKRLPTESEYEFASTGGGTRRFPWGDNGDQIQQWPIGVAGTPEYDFVEAGRRIFGLYSNVAEWTSSWAAAYPPQMDYRPGLAPRSADTWIVRGGPPSVMIGEPKPAEFTMGPRGRVAQHEMALLPGLGFRCARSARPRLESSDLERFVRD